MLVLGKLAMTFTLFVASGTSSDYAVTKSSFKFKIPKAKNKAQRARIRWSIYFIWP